jgi:hypothetical protein
MNVLPQRPLHLHPAFVSRTKRSALLLGIILGAGVLGMFAWQYGDLSRFLHEQEIWETGLTATEVSVEGEESYTTPIITLGLVKFYDYDLTVIYTDNGGETHEQSYIVDSGIKAIDTSAEPVIKYSPTNTNDFVLSWAMDLGWGRWTWLGFKWIMILVFGGLLVMAVYSAQRVSRNARLVADDSDEVHLEVEKIEPFLVNGSHHGQFTIHYLLPDNVKKNAAMQPPLLIEKAGKQYMVALTSKQLPNVFTLLEESLLPFAFNEEEEAQIQRNIEKIKSNA